MNLDELKQKALAAGFTKICRDAEGAPPVSLATWRGVSADEVWRKFESLPAIVAKQVVYHLEGNKVRAKRAVDKQFWYILS